MPELLAALDAFIQEHHRCGELDGGVDGERAWTACGSSTSRLLLGVVTAVIITLTGCTKTSWIIPPGGSEQQLRRDSHECRRDAAMLAPAPRPVSPASTGFVHPSEGYTMLLRGSAPRREIKHRKRGSSLVAWNRRAIAVSRRRSRWPRKWDVDIEVSEFSKRMSRRP